MKKLLALLLCTVMVLSVLAGCTGSRTQTDGPNYGVEIPEDYTLTIAVATNLLVEDYETNAITRWLEEETGINIDFQTYASSARDYRAQITTEFQVPGQKMPDLFLGMDMGSDTLEDFGKEGYIIDLARYFEDEEKSANWWSLLNQIEDKTFVDYVKRKMMSDNGESVWAFPTVDYSTYDMMRHQAFINQEWLDKLGLPMPTNTEELYNTLVAFRDRDPNGNGEKDEIPLIGRANANYGDVVSWIINMFCYMEDARTWRVDDNGKISGFYWDEQYREALIFANKLMKEGLLASTIYTIQNTDIVNLINPIDGVETVGIFLGHPSTIFQKNSDSVNIYKAMPQWGYDVMDMGILNLDTFISRDCEYPDAAWKVLMALSTMEGSYRLRYGEKGVDWEDATPGTKSYLGLDAEINVINSTVYGAMGNQTFGFIRGTIGLANENERTEFSDNISAFDKAKLTLMADCYKIHWDNYNGSGGRPDNVVMPLIYTAEEDYEVNTWRNNVNNWYKTHRADFIKGVKDPSNDAQWAEYIKGFETQGYYQWLEVAQDVYDFTYGDKASK